MKTLNRSIIAAFGAAFIGLTALVAAGCAGPTTRSAEATTALTEMASFEALPGERNCQWLVRGKYTAQHCERR